MIQRPCEVTKVHTRLLRVTLEIESSVAYWKYANPSLTHAELAASAVEQQWFGKRSPARVRKLVDELSSRFFPFPDALEELSKWNDISEQTRRLVCHWHVQLTDVVYRKFSGELLTELRGPDEGAVITRPLVADWLEGLVPGKWGTSTRLKFASNLITIGAEAGLIALNSRERTMLTPSVESPALDYLLRLLDKIQFDGTMTDNPYVRSVGLTSSDVSEALTRMGRQ